MTDAPANPPRTLDTAGRDLHVGSTAENALVMARRVMRRNLERALEMKDAYDIDTLNAMILECEMWIRDYGQPQQTTAPAGDVGDGDASE